MERLAVPRASKKRLPSAMAERIREARLRLRRSGQPGSLEAIAEAMNEMGVAASASYLSLIENGLKVPSEAVAVGLARVLDEDEDLFRSWALLKGHHDATEIASAAALLKQRLPGGLLSDPGVTREWLEPGDIRFEADSPEQESVDLLPDSSPRAPKPPPEERIVTRLHRHQVRLDAPAPPALSPSPPRPRSPSPRKGRLVPFHHSLAAWDEGTPPAGALALSPRLSRRLNLGAEAFAFPVTAGIARRVRSRGIGDGLIAVVMERPLSVEMGEVYVVRHEGRLLLSHLWWDHQTLVLLPDTQDDDLVRVTVHAADLGRHVIGRVAIAHEQAVQGLPQAPGDPGV